MDKLKSKPKTEEKVTQLPTMKEKEMELDSLLSAEEEAAYEKLDKQKMSDQGMVKTEELVDAAKNVYRKGKKAVGKMVEGAKKMLSGDTIKKAGKDTSSGMTSRMFTKGVAKAIEDTSAEKEK